MTGGALQQDDILVLLDEVEKRETAMREQFHTETDLHFQDFESRIIQMISQWQSFTQQSFIDDFQNMMATVEAKLASQKKEFMALAKLVESFPRQIKKVQEDMESDLDDLQEQLRELEHSIPAKVSEVKRLSAQDVGVALQMEGITGLTLEQVDLIVKRALKRYSEDRIGMVDYALESAGASVISTRCSETYDTKSAMLSVFGIPLWYYSQSPRVILQPDVYPGNCWAFQGSQGFAVIHLSSKIYPTAVTLEHIPRSLSPKGTIPSAPKDFIVFGFEEEGQQEGVRLGKFTYDQDGDPIQTFRILEENMNTIQQVELRILSNWGHPEYTCIYRFRVHGEPAS